jgi:hypothetical protein
VKALLKALIVVLYGLASAIFWTVILVGAVFAGISWGSLIMVVLALVLWLPLTGLITDRLGYTNAGSRFDAFLTSWRL